MKTQIEIDLKPFTVPNFVIAANDLKAREEGCENQSFPLAYLSSETLDQMCREFRDAVFEKAGKRQPPEALPECPKCARLQAVR